MPATATGRGAQAILSGEAQAAARGAYSPQLRVNSERMATLVLAGTAPDGSTADGSTLTGTQPDEDGIQPADLRLLATMPLLVAVQHRPITDNFVDLTTQNSLNSRMLLMSPANSAISDIVVSLPGSYWPSTAAETDWPVAYTVTAAIEYPIGTFTPLYVNGSTRTLSVTPGRAMFQFDPCPIYIPANTAFALKTFVNWSAGHFPLTTFKGGYLVGEWCNGGTGLTDQTLTVTTFTNAPINSQAGFGSPAIYARQLTRTAIVGLLGDSISAATSDVPEPNASAMFMEFALRNQVPVIAVPRGSDSAAIYLTRHETRDALLRDQNTGAIAITDLVCAFGRNDMLGSGDPTVLQTNMTQIFQMWLGRGVRVWAVTVTPQTTSSDGWITAANQTIADAGKETSRLLYNAWLRANWRSLGLSGIFEWARAIDPSDSGKWGIDAGIADTRNSAKGFATLTARGISSVVRASYNGNNSGGAAYPLSTTVPCIVYPVAGDTGRGGGVVTGNSNGSAAIATYTVNAPGDYDYAPDIILPGRWTNDGTHPNVRGYQQILRSIPFGPRTFAL